jgi:N-acetylneuraminic acid mutarotase
VDDKMYVVLKDVLRIYDLATNSWSVGTSRPVSVISPASGVIDGKIYVAGGNFGSPTFTTSDDLHRYDPATDSWETLASMPGEREALGGGAIGGRFCVFGGRLVNPNPTGARFSETFCYDPTTDTWSQAPDMLTPRAELASTELGQAVYALGGRPQNDALQGNVAERLVPDTPFP